VRNLHHTSRVPWICAVNIEEVMRGAHREDQEWGLRFLGAMHLAPLGRAEGVRAGEWRREYARKGVTLSQADCLIAAAAMGVGARLATANPKDFPMPELELENWPAGS
jgi:predicted nucleic acid-binding protein